MGTMALIDPSTRRTCPRCMARIDEGDGHARQHGVVRDKLPQSIERATVLATILRPVNRDPVGDARQGYPAPRVLGFRHQLLGDAMGYVSGKPGFRASPPLEQKARAQLGVVLPQAVHLAPRVGLAVRVGGDVDDPQIHAQPIVGLKRRRFGDIDDDRKIAPALSADQVGWPANTAQALRTISVHHDGDHNTPVSRQERHAIRTLPGQQAVVVDDGPLGSARWLSRFVPLVGFDNLAHGADGYWCREAKPCAPVAIHQMVPRDLTRGVSERPCPQWRCMRRCTAPSSPEAMGPGRDAVAV